MNDYSLPIGCYGAIAVVVIAFLLWFFRGGDEHAKPPASTTVAGGRANEYYYSEETAGGNSIFDINNPKHRQDYRHMDPIGLGRDWNGNLGDIELNMPPGPPTLQQRAYLTDPNLPIHAPLGVDGARAVKRELDANYGVDEKFNRDFARTIRSYENEQRIVDEFNENKKGH